MPATTNPITVAIAVGCIVVLWAVKTLGADRAGRAGSRHRVHGCSLICWAWMLAA